MHFPRYNSGGHHKASKGMKMRVVQTVDGVQSGAGQDQNIKCE